MARRRRICVDFDGVLHWYREGWKGATNIYDEPVPGAAKAMQQLAEEYDIHILSSRARDEGAIGAIKAWLNHYGIAYDTVSAVKEPGGIYIDDRGYRFNGDWEAPLLQIEDMDPWHKRSKWARVSSADQELLVYSLGRLAQDSARLHEGALLAQLKAEVGAREGFQTAIREAQNLLSGEEHEWSSLNILFKERVVSYVYSAGLKLVEAALLQAEHLHLSRRTLKQADAHFAALGELGYPDVGTPVEDE